jgi:outer membrane protein assembly factor BamA
MALTAFMAQADRAQAADSADASPLVSVMVTGSTKFSSDQIAAASGLHLGANVTRDDIQAGADRLARLGPFTGVNYRFSALGPGIKIEYQLSDAPEVAVEFDSFPWFTDDELVAAVKKSVPLFDGKVPARGTILDEIATAVENLLAAHGVHERVSHTLSVAGEAGSQVQVFSVAGGLNVSAIEFSDPLANSDHAVMDRASDLVGNPFSRSSVELFELEQVRPVYLAHGFLRVQFGTPNAQLAGGAKDAPSDRVTVLAPVERGPVYNWNGVTWKGNYAVPADALDDLIKLNTGDVADGMKIQAGLDGVRDIYSGRGFLDVKVLAIPKFDDTEKRVSYSISIDEGPQYHMGNLILTGLSVDGEKRIREAWKIPAASVFDKTAYENFVDLGIKKAFAGLPYRYEKIGRFLQENAQESKVDVMIDFQ